jgi:hypothetical protein
LHVDFESDDGLVFHIRFSRSEQYLCSTNNVLRNSTR